MKEKRVFEERLNQWNFLAFTWRLLWEFYFTRIKICCVVFGLRAANDQRENSYTSTHTRDVTYHFDINKNKPISYERLFTHELSIV